jgi:hypothetical protein
MQEAISSMPKKNLSSASPNNSKELFETNFNPLLYKEIKKEKVEILQKKEFRFPLNIENPQISLHLSMNFKSISNLPTSSNEFQFDLKSKKP